MNNQQMSLESNLNLNDINLNNHILECLLILGYKEQDPGTYFIQEVIFNTVKSLNILDKTDIYEQLQNAYSQFYFNIARNIHGIGVSTFHMVIKNAIDNKKTTQTSEDLSYKIFSGSNDELNFASKIMNIANYIAKNINKNNGIINIRKKKRYKKIW